VASQLRATLGELHAAREMLAAAAEAAAATAAATAAGGAEETVPTRRITRAGAREADAAASKPAARRIKMVRGCVGWLRR